MPRISSAEDLPAIVLDTDSFESKNFRLYDVVFSGRISKLVSRLEVSFDNGETWKPVESSSTASSIGQFVMESQDCSESCRFQGLIQDVGELWPILLNLTDGDETSGLLRGVGDFGKTTVSSFHLRKLKKGYVSVGALGLSTIGLASQSLSTGSLTGYRIESARVEAQPVTAGSGTVKVKGILR